MVQMLILIYTYKSQIPLTYLSLYLTNDEAYEDQTLFVVSMYSVKVHTDVLNLRGVLKSECNHKFPSIL